MMPGIDPQKLVRMQEVSQHIRASIRVEYPNSLVVVAFSTVDDKAMALIPELVEQFSNALAAQLKSYFAIEGEIIEVSKPDKQD